MMTPREMGSRFHWNIATATVSDGTGTTGVHERLGGVFSSSSSTRAPLGRSDKDFAHAFDFARRDCREHRNGDDFVGGAFGHGIRPVREAFEWKLAVRRDWVVKTPPDA